MLTDKFCNNYPNQNYKRSNLTFKIISYLTKKLRSNQLTNQHTKT